ncbi:MAG TPA: FAD-dependent monooxygenase [Cyanophyceae cyanobacterium]
MNNGNHAVVIGGSMAGLLAARILVNHFDRVTVVERDFLPEEPQPRQGVPQSSHVHVVLLKGQQILEQLFPGLGDELSAADAPTVDWTKDGLWLNVCGWTPRFPSNLTTRTCSRYFLEWAVRRRLSTYKNLQFLDGTQVKQLLTDESQSTVTGVQIRSHNDSQERELTADFVVDASGRNSPLPKWLENLGYPLPPETTINSFLGYSNRWYQCPEGFQADWKVLLLAYKPPYSGRSGMIFPIEGNRWIVNLSGVGRDYPPTDEAGFLEFARTLRSPILYETIKNAQPLSPVYSYRRTENRWRHYEKLSKLPEGLVAIGDAVCAFNPFYGQGITTAALGALTLDQCLSQQFQRKPGSFTGLTKRFQKQLAHILITPWLMATGEDFRWPTTQGGNPNWMNRLIQGYMDRVLQLSVEHPEVHQTFIEIIHMVKPTTALFQPNILLRVLGRMIDWRNHKDKDFSEINEPQSLVPISQEDCL